MAEGINITDLAIKPAAALTSADSMVTFTADGDTNQTPMFEAVAKANGENGQASVISYDEDFTSAEILAAVSASPVAIAVPRAAGQTIVIQSAYVGMTADVTTPYDTNVTVAVRYVGAAVPIYTCQVLDRTVTGSVPMTINTTATVGQTVLMGDADLEWYVVGGAALSGSGNLGINLTVALI